ncbi:proton-conducting transporter membrane subunit [Desulfurococcus mucosus]|uniref:NADH/Ubiquinone/plastoquinone (Complex I) n=2 Tax=Desulfurococcus mucosus TaxID=2275 RepID=E8R6Y5_DESM0|nr:proton-conducting transporter membrane subunit [Desulfurococcus mucosus]ADV64418.1 NADH/Ubiquinone/plastoquinone (complex I) [Desulfurococcus mucosus DSM 2162]
MLQHVVGLIPFLPVLGAFITPLTYIVSRSRRVVFAQGVAFSLITLVLSLIAVVQAYREGTPSFYIMGGWPPPLGITYTLDMVSALLALTTSLVMTIIMAYSAEYIVDEGYPWYVTLMLGAFSGMLGVIMTSDVFNLFVMLEVTGVSSYGLVMYYRSKAGSIVSGLKYAFIGAMGTTLYLLALALIYNTYGSLNLVDLSLKIHGYPGSSITLEDAGYSVISAGIIMVLALWTFSIKSGVFPNHFWLPDAHPAAPAPVSAMLSGLVVNVGAIGLYKVLYMMYGGTLPARVTPVRDLASLLVVSTGMVSAIIGALLMGIQQDVKRIIAYSTVMNTGYIFMSLGVLNAGGLLAFLYHTVVHSLAKSTLFLGIGVLVRYAGTRRINELAGFGRIHPLPGIAIGVSVLTLAGIPPLPGFLSKLLMYEALFNYNPVFAIAMIVASAIGLLAYMKLFFTLLFEAPVRKPRDTRYRLAEASALTASLILLVVGAACLFNPGFFNTVFIKPVDQVSDLMTYINHLAKSLI